MFFRYNWSKVALAYNKNGATNWSGNNTCFLFMSSIVEVAKGKNITMDTVRLDETDKLYPNDPKKMLEEQKALFDDYGGK